MAIDSRFSNLKERMNGGQVLTIKQTVITFELRKMFQLSSYSDFDPCVERFLLVPSRRVRVAPERAVTDTHLERTVTMDTILPIVSML